MYNNDLINELGTNFIEYAVAVNSDRSVPNATDGLKPVAKRIIYGAYDCGFRSNKPHVKCANVVGNVMADFHPHGDSSIYGALVRLSQSWVMRYPLIDFHGSNGNIDGDGPAHYRYTESRLAKLTEDGMLSGIKKNNVDFVSNYSETKEEPVELPALFPNLLCNPNSGIGVAIASNWGCANLGEVAQAVYDYMDGKEPMLYPDFPTGAILINKNDVPSIMRTGRGSVKLRAKYNIDKNNIVFTELPYGVATEALMTQIGKVCETNEITGISDIRNESNKKGFRLVIECEKDASQAVILKKLFAKTDLQSSFAYNQVALVNKTPTLLNLKDCIKIYINHNIDCIKKEVSFDIKKTEARIHIINGLIKALNIIDEIIAMIKASTSSNEAKNTLMSQWNFSEEQAKAILDMKLAKLAKLEKNELFEEKQELEKLLSNLNYIYNNPDIELRKRLNELVEKYGDARRTELIQLEEPKEEKEIEFVEPEKCVVVLTESGCVKRIPATSFRNQRRNGKGVKTQDDITSMVLRTNTIDSLMIFTNQGRMYRLLVNDIPVGTNVSKGQAVSSLIEMESGEKPVLIYSIYRDTNAKYVFFVTKNGTVKKTALSEYTGTKKKGGVIAIKLREGDSLAAVSLINDEPIILVSKNGMAIKFKSTDVSTSSRATIGMKGMNIKDDDEIVAGIPVRDTTDELAVFSSVGLGKKIKLEELPYQTRGGKGLIIYKSSEVISAVLVSEEDSVLLCGDKSSICISASEIPNMGRTANGNQLIKGNRLINVSKV